MVDCVGGVIAGASEPAVRLVAARVAASTQNEGARKISPGRNLAASDAVGEVHVRIGSTKRNVAKSRPEDRAESKIRPKIRDGLRDGSATRRTCRAR
jgi:hypothetical protein